MADVSQPNDPNVNTPDDHLSRLLCAEIEDPWYRTFVRNLKEFFNPPKLPPLQVTSKPIPVKDIWGLYGRKKQSFMMSTGFQIGVVALVFVLTASKTVQKAAQKAVLYAIDLAPPELKMKPQAQASQARKRSKRREVDLGQLRMDFKCNQRQSLEVGQLGTVQLAGDRQGAEAGQPFEQAEIAHVGQGNIGYTAEGRQ